MISFSIEQAKKHPENFLYVFASNAYLKKIPSKYATIIRGKRANQNKLILLYVKENSSVTYDQCTDAIRQALIDAYRMTPAEILVALAKGKTVAGKNFAKGVFGIGAVKTNTFGGIKVNDQDVTVDPDTGHIFAGSEDLTDNSSTVYGDLGNGKTGAYQLFTTGGTYTFMSQYDEKTKKYYAGTYTGGENNSTYSASTGEAISSADNGTVWQGVITSLQTFIQWLLSLFGSGTQTINEKNTLPNQLDDGYVVESGFGEAGAILLALAAGGAMLYGSRRQEKKKK